MVGKKFCDICNKRRGNFSLTVKINRKQEKNIIVCKFCNQKYILLRERFLTKAYNELVNQMRRPEDDQR